MVSWDYNFLEKCAIQNKKGYRFNQVNERYQEFFVNYEDGPLLIINTNNIDFVENSDDFDNLLNEIHQPHQGIKYFNPA